MQPTVLVLWLTRVGLVISMGISVVFSDGEQLAGKGMGFRAPFYLLPLVVDPAIWRLRGSHPPCPHLVDALVIAPFLADTLGNVLNSYNRYDVTDDVLHFLNGFLLFAAVGTAGLQLTYRVTNSACASTRGRPSPSRIAPAILTVRRRGASASARTRYGPPASGTGRR